MKKNLRFLVVAAVGLVGAVAFSSCTYDPYYTSVGGSYSTGYGDGYGYGGSSFNTSVFVGTGNPRWGYDPYCYSYYDYNRRAYYDPYLNGYYPVGYRPQVVYGVSHPYGWRPGGGYLRPPSRVNNVTIHNYRNRESAYRNSGYISSGRSYSQRPVQGGYNGGNYQSRPPQGGYNRENYQSRPPQGGYNRENYQSRPPQSNPGADRYRNNNPQQTPRYPSRYNTPVTSQPDYSRGTRGQNREVRPLAPPDESRAPRQRTQAPQRQAPQAQNQQSQPSNPQAKARGARNETNGGGRWGGRNLETE